MKFGQLIEYKKRKTCLEKSCTKCGGESPDSFLKSQTEHISGSII